MGENEITMAGKIADLLYQHKAFSEVDVVRDRGDMEDTNAVVFLFDGQPFALIVTRR